MEQQQDDYIISSVFPTPIYKTNWDYNLWEREEGEIEDIAKGELVQVGALDYHSKNLFLFNTKLKKLKEFCELHVEKYVKEVLSPAEDVNFYITSSWLNVVKPGGGICAHTHSNSIISGSFYSKTVEEDKITFYDPNRQRREARNSIEIASKFSETSPLQPYSENLNGMEYAVFDGDLLLFPSWLMHGVMPNKRATQDRFSISFNVFVKGTLGSKGGLDELII